jgi:nitrogen regulatory protein P-II 1
MRFKLIVSMVKPDVTGSIVDAAKEVGGTGATIVSGRGTGMHEARTFFGLSLEIQTDVVLLLLEEHLVDTVLEAISKAGRFQEPGTGIAFVLPAEQVVGLESQLEKFKKAAQKKYF